MSACGCDDDGQILRLYNNILITLPIIPSNKLLERDEKKIKSEKKIDLKLNIYFYISF